MATLTISGAKAITDADVVAFLDTTTDPRYWFVKAGDILRFDPAADTTLTVDNRNLGVHGELEMRPNDATIEHLLRFTNINEALFTGSKARAISSAVVISGTTVEFTVVLEPGQTHHNLTADDVIIVSGLSPATWNGTFAIDSVPSSTKVRCTISPAPSGPGSGAGLLKANDHQPNKNDIGLWILEGGVFDAVGTPRKTWTRSVAAVAGTNGTVQTEDDVSSWQVGDEIAVFPTNRSWTDFDIVTVRAGTTGTTFNWTGTIAAGRHPYDALPDGSFTGAELVNLTNNVRIEGTPTGRTHVMWHPHVLAPPVVSHVTLRYMGPRQDNGNGSTRKIVGRWGAHVHKAEDNSVGAIFTGVVARDMGSHAFVNHASNYITYFECVAYNVFEFPFWWDFDAISDFPDGTVWDRCGAGIIDSVEDFHRSGGFQLHLMDVGLNSIVRDCFVAGNKVGGRDDAGFMWPEAGPGGLQDSGATKEWLWQGRNVSHNNRVNGVFVWMNDTQTHHVPFPVAYRNGQAGISFGAYFNCFQWTDCVVFDNGWNTPSGTQIHLNANGRFNELNQPQLWTGRFDCAGNRPWLTVGFAAVNGTDRVRMHDPFIENPGNPIIRVVETNQQPHLIDIVRARVDTGSGYRDLVQGDFLFEQVRAGTAFRVQRMDDASAFRLYTPGDPTAEPGQPSSPAQVVFEEIAPFALHITTPELGDGTNGTAYSQTLVSALGQGSLRTWSIKSGSLPLGLSLNPSTGAITGTPTTNGDYTFTVQVLDAGAVPALKEFTVTVAGGAVPLSITTSALPAGIVGTAYAGGPVQATGGTSPYIFARTAGALPPGMSMSSAGALTGTPSAAGTYNFTVQVTDDALATASKPLSIVVQPALVVTTTSLPPGVDDVAYGPVALNASNGTSPYSWSNPGGGLPPGVTLSAAGVLSGTPTTPGTASFTVRVTDAALAIDDQALELAVAAALSVDPASLGGGFTGQWYEDYVTASGGIPPYHWEVVGDGGGSGSGGGSGGVPPPGVALTDAPNGLDGLLSGIPTAYGTFPFRVRVNDANEDVAELDVEISIEAAALPRIRISRHRAIAPR